MPAKERPSLLDTELGRKLLRDAAETILTVLNNDDGVPLLHDGTPVRDGDFRQPSVAHDTPAAPEYFHEPPVLNTRSPKMVEDGRTLRPRAFYSAGRPSPRADLTGLTAGTITILNALVAARRRLSVKDLMEQTSLKRKTVENAVSLLRQRGLLSNTETNR